MTGPQHRLHSWHIAVPQGDAAIHLLVTPNTATGPKWIIERAVLIDGGKYPASVARILNTIAHINESKNYLFNPNNRFDDPVGGESSLRFDSIVVTHWDRDHYEGVLGLLLAGVRKANEAANAAVKKYSFNAEVLAVTAPAAPGDGGGNLAKVEKIDKNGCWYCKYGSDGSLMAESATTIFASNKVTRLGPLVGPPRRQISASGGLSIEMVDMALKPDAGGLRSTKLAGFLFGGTRKKGLFKMSSDHEAYIGRNLLLGQGSLTTADPVNWKTLDTATKFVDAVAGASTEPGFYIVAGNGFAVGNPAAVTVQASPYRGPDVPTVNGNAKSIVAVALRKGSGASAKPEVWHYTGGDTLWHIEAAISRWLGVLVDEGSSADPLDVKAMKLSLHGSRGACSIDLLANINPQYVVLPTETGVKDYGRPSPEVSLFLYIQYLRSQVAANVTANTTTSPSPVSSRPTVLPLGYPQWVGSGSPENSSLGSGYFPIFVSPTGPLSTTPGYKQFKDAVEHFADYRTTVRRAFNNTLAPPQDTPEKSEGAPEDPEDATEKPEDEPDNPGIGAELASMYKFIGSALASMFPAAMPDGDVPLEERVASWFLDLGAEDTAVVQVRDRRGVMTVVEESSAGERVVTDVTDAIATIGVEGPAWLVAPAAGEEGEAVAFKADDPFADPEHDSDPPIVLDLATGGNVHTGDEVPEWTEFAAWVRALDMVHLSGKAFPVDVGTSSLVALRAPDQGVEGGAGWAWTWPEMVVGNAAGVSDVAISTGGTLEHGKEFEAGDVKTVVATAQGLTFSSAAATQVAEGGRIATTVLNALAAVTTTGTFAAVKTAAANWFPGVEDGAIPVMKGKFPVLVLPLDVGDGEENKVPEFSVKEIKSLLPASLRDEIGTSADSLKIPISAPARNALYITADQFSATDLRLEFSFEDAAADALSVVKNMLGFLKKDILPDNIDLPVDTLSCVKTTRGTLHVTPDAEGKMFRVEDVKHSCTLAGTMNDWFPGFSYWLHMTPTTQGVHLRFYDPVRNPDNAFKDVPDMGDVVGKLTQVFDKGTFGVPPFDDLLRELRSAFGSGGDVSLSALSASISKTTGTSPTDMKGRLFGEVKVVLKLFSQNWVISLSFPNYGVRAELWDFPTFAGPPNWLPHTEQFELAPVPLTPESVKKPKLLAFLDGSDLSGAIEDSKWGGLQSVKLAGAFFELAKTVEGYHLEVGGAIELSDKDLGLNQASFAVKLGANFGNGPKEFSLNLSAFVELKPFSSDGEVLEPGRIGLDVVYATSASKETFLTVTGRATDLRATDLLNYVEEKYQDVLFPILEGIEAPSVQLDYDYRKQQGKDKKATSLLVINGTLRIKKLLLDLNFMYGSLEPTEEGQELPWEFGAKLGGIEEGGGDGVEEEEDTTVKLGDIVGIFSDELKTLLDAIPVFRDIEVETSFSDSGSPGIEFEVSKVTTLPGEAMVTWVRVQVKILSVRLSAMLVFLTMKNPDATTTGTPSRRGKSIRKVYLRLRLDQIDILNKIPIIGSIPVPFDAVDYVLVQHKKGGGKSSTGAGTTSTAIDPRKQGFTLEEIEAINEKIPEDAVISVKDTQSKVQTKASGEGAAGPARDNAVLRMGHHFMVVKEGKVLLDHVFGQNSGGAAGTAAAGNKKGKALAAAGLEGAGVRKSSRRCGSC